MAKCLSNSYIDEGQSASFGVTGGFQKNRDRTHREFFCVELWGNGPNLWKLGIHATVLTGERGLPCGFEPLFGKVPWRREWHPTPVFLPGESHGQRSLGGYSSWGLKRVGHDCALMHSCPFSISLSHPEWSLEIGIAFSCHVSIASLVWIVSTAFLCPLWFWLF